MKCYPAFTEQHIRKGITGMRGWVYYNWSIENEAHVWGSPIKRTSKGYVAQEIDRILDHG